MFTVHVTDGTASITAEASVVANAVSFVADYWTCARPILSPWQQQDGRWVAYVCDWDDCWYEVQQPPLARIVAPEDFVPAVHETLEYELEKIARLKLKTKTLPTNPG